MYYRIKSQLRHFSLSFSPQTPTPFQQTKIPPSIEHTKERPPRRLGLHGRLRIHCIRIIRRAQRRRVVVFVHGALALLSREPRRRDAQRVARELRHADAVEALGSRRRARRDGGECAVARRRRGDNHERRRLSRRPSESQNRLVQDGDVVLSRGERRRAMRARNRRWRRYDVRGTGRGD